MRLFSKEKFIKAEGYKVYLKCKYWVDKCDGKRVIGEYVGNYISDRDWEIETEEVK